jgi:hypothetical protein
MSKFLELEARCGERHARVQVSVKGLTCRRLVDVVSLAVARWQLPAPLTLVVGGVEVTDAAFDLPAFVRDAQAAAARREALPVKLLLM